MTLENIVGLIVMFSLIWVCLKNIHTTDRRKHSYGAVTLNTVLAGPTMNIQDVIASADGDVTATIVHTLPATPLVCILTQILSQAITALSVWTSAIGAANNVLTKLASAGSGSASKQLRCVTWSPHTVCE